MKPYGFFFLNLKTAKTLFPLSSVSKQLCIMFTMTEARKSQLIQLVQFAQIHLRQNEGDAAPELGKKNRFPLEQRKQYTRH